MRVEFSIRRPTVASLVRAIAEPDVGPGEVDILPTLCCLFAAVVLIGAGYGIWDNVASDLHVLALASSLLCYVGAFALIVFGFTRSRYRTAAVVAGVAFAFFVYALSYLLFKVRFYDSDAMLFNSYSAQLFLKGIDPYTRSMQPGYQLFGVPAGEVTPTLDGGEVYSLSYPALSFLVYVPFLVLRISNLLWVSIAAHVIVILMLVAIAPPRLKALAPFVLFLDATYFEYTLGGITDILWVPAAIATAAFWHKNPRAAATWLGVACAFKQTPWIVVPFATVYWSYAWRASKRSADFTKPMLRFAAAFAIPNLPFVLWHPQAWFAGVATPLSAHLIVLGSGIAQLATSGLVSFGPATFTATTAFAACAALFLYVLFPKRLAFLPFVAPAFVLFFAARSLQNYFMYWPIVLVAYVFANAEFYFAEARNDARPPASWKIAATFVVLAVMLVPLASRSHAKSLAVRIVGGERNAQTGRIDRLRVAVANHSNEASLVHFDVSEHGEDVSVQAWKPRSLQRLDAGVERIFTIFAPSRDLQLKVNGSSATQAIALDWRGRETVSRPIVFAARVPKIFNADLTYWSVGARPYPIAWTFEPSAWKRGDVARARVAGRDAVRLKATTANGRGSSTALEQITDARSMSLRFWIYPRADFDERRSFFGVEVRDVFGRAVFYTIDHLRRTPATVRTEGATINVLPGRLDAWNEIVVDLQELHARDGFLISPGATMVVGALALVKAGAPAEASGAFGGVQTENVRRPGMAILSPDEPPFAPRRHEDG